MIGSRIQPGSYLLARRQLELVLSIQVTILQGTAPGQAADIVIKPKKVMRLDDIIRGILVKHTNPAREKIQHDTDRDFYLNPLQAIE